MEKLLKTCESTDDHAHNVKHAFNLFAKRNGAGIMRQFLLLCSEREKERTRSMYEQNDAEKCKKKRISFFAMAHIISHSSHNDSA